MTSPVTLPVAEAWSRGLSTAAHRVQEEKSFFSDLSSLKSCSSLGQFLSYEPLNLANVYFIPLALS